MGIHLADAAISQVDDPVCHLCDTRVMSDHRGSGAQLPIDPLQCFQHDNAGLGIERTGGFVA